MLYKLASTAGIIGLTGRLFVLEESVIEKLSNFPDNVAAFACHGHVTKSDYETVLIPEIEDKLQRHNKIGIYYEIGPDLDGIAPGAMWEDTKVGLGLRRLNTPCLTTLPSQDGRHRTAVTGRRS